MNYINPNPDGIDVVINRIQNKAYQPLLDAWTQLDALGRVHKIEGKDGELRLRRYVGNSEYEPVLFSEGNKIFFIQGDQPSINLGQATNTLYAVVILKLSGVDSIEDEKAHKLVITQLVGVLGLEAVKGLRYGMDNLKRIVEEPFEKTNFKYSDIHPYHVFIVECEVDYAISNNNC